MVIGLQESQGVKVVLSTGHGRLHLVQSALWLCRADVDVTMLTGWIPRYPDGLLVRLASKLVHRDLAPGMKKRQVPELAGHVLSCTFAEVADTLLRLVGRKFGWDKRNVSVLGWKIFGWQSAGKLRGAVGKMKNRVEVEERSYHNSSTSTSNFNSPTVFHVRSGAGHGGAIAAARKLGMKIVVDHSIAHPAYMERELRGEYEKRGVAFDLGISSPFWQMIEEDCRWADRILVNSYFVKDTFVAEGYDPEKIAVAYLGVRPDFFGLRVRGKLKSKVEVEERKFRLLFTGGFGFRKGGEYILEALKIINAKRPGSFTMDFVGSYERSIISAFANDLHIAYETKDGSSALQLQLPTSTSHPTSTLTFHGPIPQDDLKAYLASSDIYIFPSLAEGCASSGMEAMAAGMCVVATHESGFPIADGETGYIVPKKNAQAIADRVLWLMDHPEEIDRMGANAAELIRTKYTWEQYAESVKEMYEELGGS